MQTLAQRLPEYAKDLKLNLTTLLRQSELTAQQIWGTAVASAWASGNADVIRDVLAEAEAQLSPEAMNGAKIAATIMAMNNVYYRFTHLASNPRYREIPARLRMNAIRAHGTSPVDFELWCLAVSAIHGCGACVDSHERVVREKGLTEEGVAAAVRIAAVIRAIASVLDAEAAVAGRSAPATPQLPVAP